MSGRHRRALPAVPARAVHGRALLRAVFGDRGGATVFLISLAWVGLYWRLGFFSTDQLTFANALLGVVDGHLHIAEAVYGPASGNTPGTYLVDGRVYGRNYGIVVVSAVWLLALDAAAAVADVRVLVLGLWLLALVGAVAGVGRWLDRPELGLRAGIGLAAVSFVANLLVATPLAPRWHALLALQFTTSVAAALTAVALYRLVGRLYSRRVAVFAGLVAILGTPVGFWASLPKRHSVTALLVVLALYTLYRSRDASDRRTATRFRALTYAWCGLAAWVHAAEGLILLFAIAAVDLPTARWNRPRDLAVVGLALFASLLPFFVTNALISGNPLHPPRLLPGYDGGVLGVEGSGSPTGEADSALGTVDAGDDSLSADPLAGVSSAASLGIGVLSTAATRLGTQLHGSFGVLVTDPQRAATIFVRTGYVPSVRASQDVAVNLSVLSSMPLLGAVVAVPILAGRAVANARPREVRDFRIEWTPVRVVDALSIVYVVLLFGLFLRQLPIHHMLTVRYLHPLYAVGVYWLVRLPAVRRAVDGHAATVTAGFLAALLVGGGLYVAAIDRLNLALGESVQLYALCALVVAATVAVWTLLSTATGRHGRSGAAVLGLGAGTTAAFLLVSGLSLFPVTGEFLLPMARSVAESLHYMRLFGSTPPF